MTRIAIIDKQKCHPAKCGQECIKDCPVNRQGAECVVIGTDKKAKIDEKLCIGCGICTKRCPFDAIRIVNLPEALKEKPIYRYAANSFELFRLPIPEKGRIVGMIGANGIGKSTALDILAGLTKPNLGEYGLDHANKKIIDHFKGTELQKYFEDLFDKKVKLSYKPQYIDQIPKQFKGKVSDLLVGDNVKEIVERLGISPIMDREVENLSGGELQKVAISASMLKDVQLYFLDEPSSYLDIKERIKIAKEIQNLADNGKSVVVVEHDLIMLDYLADLMHILFGKTAAYGVVSHPLSSKKGVNTYLDGYLRDENIRFRDDPISFEHSILDVKEHGEVSVQWPDIYKKLGTFRLEIEASEMYAREIVGIVGANGIGKTTMMNILAGQIEPDKGILKKLKISYKPQYIKVDSDKTVEETLREIVDTFSQSYKLNILQPLEIEHLLDKKVNELSGGELQRVSVAVCLSRKADLYLLDEPSTYLDVEQRLQVAKVIRKVVKDKEAVSLVIDHDLLFASYISDRVLVFTGEPAKRGKALAIKPIKEAMNIFLKELDITMRRDPETHRPRINKHGSVKDRAQRNKGEYF